LSRIKATFAALAAQKRTALIPFVTAGDPTAAITVSLMHTLVKAGADVIELGVPFSDPMADGPVIQRASERALKNGVGLINVLAYVSQFRETNTITPVVLMGYANPIERMGLAIFAARAKAAGVDGVLVVDYPPEESVEVLKALDAVGIDSIYLLKTTSAHWLAHPAFADAVVIGSRIIQELEASPPEAALVNVEKLVSDIRHAMDA